MKASVTQIAILMFPQNQLGGTGSLEKVSPNHFAIPLLPNYHFKSIFSRGVFYKIFFLLNLLLLTGIQIQAQPNDNYALYANIIYRFTKYIQWPDDKKPGEFVIGIVGDSPLYDELIKFTEHRMAGNKKIVIRKFSSSRSSFNCQILFICEDESSNIKKIAAATSGASTLIISESEGLAGKGSGINITIIDDHLRLEINKNNIERRNLNIASELLQLGIIVT